MKTGSFRKSSRAAVVTDKAWARKINEFEGP